MSPLNKFYQALLRFCGAFVDDTGRVYYLSPEGTETKDRPMKVAGKHLILPTQDNLRKSDLEKEMIFHPVIESVNRAESDVLKQMRQAINVRLNVSISMLIGHLMAIVASPKIHSKMSPEQRELFLGMPEITEEMLNTFYKFFSNNISEYGSRFFTNIYLKKGGTFKGEKHACVGIVQFPVEELMEDSDVGKSLKPKDKKAISAIMAYIFPEHMTDSEAYNNFSDSVDAPRLEALMKTASCIASRINYLVDLFNDVSAGGADVSEELEEIKFNMDWESLFKIDKYRNEIRMIPSQSGNDGQLPEEPVRETKRVPENTTAVRAPAEDLPVPASRQKQQETTTNGPLLSRPVIEQAPTLANQLQMTNGQMFQVVGNSLIPIQTPQASLVQTQPAVVKQQMLDDYGRPMTDALGRPLMVNVAAGGVGGQQSAVIPTQGVPRVNTNGTIPLEAMLASDPRLAAAAMSGTNPLVEQANLERMLMMRQLGLPVNANYGNALRLPVNNGLMNAGVNDVGFRTGFGNTTSQVDTTRVMGGGLFVKN